MAPARKQTAGEPSRRSERLQVANAVKVSEQEAKAKSGITKNKRFRRPRQSTKCRILKLPGEIRNIIYRFALVKPEKIDIKTDGPGEPALLRVCKRIRNEARSIYYADNTFTLQIMDFNGADFMPFVRQLNRFLHITCQANLMLRLSGIPNWDNLVAWIKADHNGMRMQPSPDDCFTRDDFVVAAAFGLAGSMSCLPWEVVEHRLGFMRTALTGTRWGDDDAW